MICTEPPPRLKDQSRWSETLHSFVAACLRSDPADRPTAVELLSHPFIQQAVSSGATQTVPVRLATEIGLSACSRVVVFLTTCFFLLFFSAFCGSIHSLILWLTVCLRHSQAESRKPPHAPKPQVLNGRKCRQQYQGLHPTALCFI